MTGGGSKERLVEDEIRGLQRSLDIADDEFGGVLAERKLPFLRGIEHLLRPFQFGDLRSAAATRSATAAAAASLGTASFRATALTATRAFRAGLRTRRARCGTARAGCAGLCRAARALAATCTLRSRRARCRSGRGGCAGRRGRRAWP